MHYTHCAALILCCCFLRQVFPLGFPTNTVLILSMNIEWEWILIYSPGKPQPEREWSQDARCHREEQHARAAPQSNMVFPHPEEIPLLGQFSWEKGVHAPDLILDKDNNTLNLPSLHKKISLKLMWASYPTFPGFLEYADAIFCLEFQITPGSQLAGEGKKNIFKLPSNYRHIM